MTLRSLIVSVLAMGTALVPTSFATGHDFWVEPSSFFSTPDARISVSLRVGHGSELVALPRNFERFERFVVAGPAGVSDVPGVEGANPAGILRPDANGTYVIGYRSRLSTVELDAAAFERYLLEEGLDAHLGKRHVGKVRERYSRNAKAIITVATGSFGVSVTPPLPSPPQGGAVPSDSSRSLQRTADTASDGASDATPGDTSGERARSTDSAPAPGSVPLPSSSATWSEPLGFSLELVPECDPGMLRVGSPTTFLLLHGGKPIEGILVRSTAMAKFEHQRSARTDARGRVTLTFDVAGPWRLNAVHMRELPPEDAISPDTGEFGAEFESLWASLVFEVPSVAGGTPEAAAPGPSIPSTSR